METVVGATALETAVHCDLLSRARVCMNTRCVPGGLNHDSTGIDFTYIPANSKELGERAEAMKTTIDQLQKERRLTKGTKVTKALSAFADNMMTKATEMKVKEVELEKEAKDDEVEVDTETSELDNRDPEKTLAIVREAIREKASMHRIPIHLADVQKSVEAALPKRGAEREAPKEHLDGSELGEEADDSRLLPSQQWLGDCSALVDHDGPRARYERSPPTVRRTMRFR